MLVIITQYSTSVREDNAFVLDQVFMPCATRRFTTQARHQFHQIIYQSTNLEHSKLTQIKRITETTMCCNKIIRFTCGHRGEITRQECTSEWSPAAFRCKASNLPTYIVDPAHPSLCPSCVSDLEAEHFEKYMNELKDIESQIEKIEKDYKDEDELHSAILNDLLKWKNGDPREQVKEECSRHRQENHAMAKLLSYWKVYLRVVDGKRMAKTGTASSQDMISLEEALAELRNLGAQK